MLGKPVINAPKEPRKHKFDENILIKLAQPETSHLFLQSLADDGDGFVSEGRIAVHASNHSDEGTVLVENLSANEVARPRFPHPAQALGAPINFLGTANRRQQIIAHFLDDGIY